MVYICHDVLDLMGMVSFEVGRTLLLLHRFFESLDSGARCAYFRVKVFSFFGSLCEIIVEGVVFLIQICDLAFKVFFFG
jgi:hypothetical protein